jgi:ANTAR domain
MSDGDQEHLIEVTGPSARSLDILARTLHVKNAELQPTLQAIASTAVKMLSPALHAGLTIFSRGELTPRASTGEAPLLLDRLAAPALAEAQRAGQLQEALGNRDVIGQAKGILMERHSITADTAFGVLSRVSQAENMKLAEIVRHLTETGKLPGASSPDSLADRRNPPSRHRGYHAQRDRRLSSGSKRGTSPYPGAGLRTRLG